MPAGADRHGVWKVCELRVAVPGVGTTVVVRPHSVVDVAVVVHIDVLLDVERRDGALPPIRALRRVEQPGFVGGTVLKPARLRHVHAGSCCLDRSSDQPNNKRDQRNQGQRGPLADSHVTPNS